MIDDVTMLDGVKIAIVAMIIVFSILIILAVMITLLKHVNVLNSKPTQVESKSKVVSTKVEKLDLNDENATVASLVACIEAREDLGNNVRVKSIKQI